MKKILSAILVMCMCFGLLAGCGGKEQDNSDKEMSSEFDSSTNQNKSIKGYTYEVPIEWEENNSTDGISYFYPENGMLMVSFEEEEGASISNVEYRKAYSEGVASGFDEYELVDSSETVVDGKPAYREKVKFTTSGKNMNGTFVTFDYSGGIITFMMGTYVSSNIDYTEDFNKIIKSIKIADVEYVINKLKKSGIPIEYKIIYTNENDPNGKEHKYLEKGNFADSRIEKEYSKEEPLSGTIEIFESRDDAVARVDYLESLDVLSLDSFAYRIVSENVLLRLNDKYSEEEIQEFADILNGEIYSKAKSDYEDLTEELENPSVTQTGYSAGMYKVGTDMPAGEYLITSSSGYYAVTSDSSGSLESIITNDNYRNRAYVTVQDGQYFQFDGSAVPGAEAAAFTPVNGVYPEGMYLVGKDIPAGEYKVSATSGGYYEVTANSTGNLGTIIANDNFDGEVYLTVQDGQYLKLSRAQIVVQ